MSMRRKPMVRRPCIEPCALMWAVSENHPDAVKILIDRGADLNVRSKVVPADAANSRGPSVTPPRDPAPGEGPKKDYYGGLTPLHFAARQGDLESARLLVA